MKSDRALIFLAILALAGAILWTHYDRPPSPAAPVDGDRLGKQYAPLVARSFGVAWLAARADLLGGKSVSDSEKTYQKSLDDELKKQFDAVVAPAFGRVVPSGTAEVTSAQRADLADLWRDFARGLGATPPEDRSATGYYLPPLVLLLIILGGAIIGAVLLYNIADWYRSRQSAQSDWLRGHPTIPVAPAPAPTGGNR